MKAEIHLYSPSFAWIAGMDPADIGDRIEAMAIDYDAIRSSEDILYKHSCIYDVCLIDDFTIADVIYSGACPSLTRDQKQALRKIIDHSSDPDSSLLDVISRLAAHSQEIVYGLLCLHSVSNISNKYLIYSERDWFVFHRYFLGIYPVSEESFVVACRKCFPRLFFHSTVQESLAAIEGGLNSFSMEIVRNLSALNDHFQEYCRPENRVETLKAFSAGCNVDATPEGNAQRKKSFTFNFDRADGGVEPVCCEPHLKLSRSDRPGDTHHYFNRIYFHEGKGDLAEGRILIGHIGKHL